MYKTLFIFFLHYQWERKSLKSHIFIFSNQKLWDNNSEFTETVQEIVDSIIFNCEQYTYVYHTSRLLCFWCRGKIYKNVGILLGGSLTVKNQWEVNHTIQSVTKTFLAWKKEGKHKLCQECPLRGQGIPTTNSQPTTLPTTFTTYQIQLKSLNPWKPLQLLTLCSNLLWY